MRSTWVSFSIINLTRGNKYQSRTAGTRTHPQTDTQTQTDRDKDRHTNKQHTHTHKWSGDAALNTLVPSRLMTGQGGQNYSVRPWGAHTETYPVCRHTLSDSHIPSIFYWEKEQEGEEEVGERGVINPLVQELKQI